MHFLGLHCFSQLLLFLVIATSELQFSTAKSISLGQTLTENDFLNGSKSISFVDLMKNHKPIKESTSIITPLTYRVNRYPQHRNKPAVDNEIVKILKLWSDVSYLNFTKKERGSVHIELSFQIRYHADGKAVDEPEGEFPINERKTVHSEKSSIISQNNSFDDNELHQALHIAHSKIKNSLILAVYRKSYSSSFNLEEIDVLAIQELYGRRREKPEEAVAEFKPEHALPTSDSYLHYYTHNPESDDSTMYYKTTLSTSTNPSSTIPPNLCRDSSIDAATNTPDGKTYFFKGDYYWRYLDESIAAGYPRKLQDNWPGLPGNLDAVLTWETGESFFFKGAHVWMYKNKSIGYGFPKEISEEFEGIPNDIDAAFVWGKTGNTYFFKGSHYWMYDPAKVPAVDSELYPQPISKWKGLPDNIDAALRWRNDKKCYFFKGNKYLRFTDEREEVYNDYPRSPYPRSTAEWWFNCGTQ